MKIAAFILAILGIGNLMTLPRVVHPGDPPCWPLTLLACIGGILLLVIAVGILRRWRFVWPLGFIAIVEGGVYSVLSVAFIHPEATDRFIILALCSVGSVIVGIFWSVVWYFQKKWFYRDTVA
jgi:hypothetical protein